MFKAGDSSELAECLQSLAYLEGRSKGNLSEIDLYRCPPPTDGIHVLLGSTQAFTPGLQQ